LLHGGDPWLGCWTRIYDADHLAKHEAQDVTAIGVSILPSPAVSGAPDKYLTRVELKVRYKPEVHTISAARIAAKWGSGCIAWPRT
jgi:hypothetical protein